MSAELHHLDAAIRKVCPIDGISGDIKDHKLVRIDFRKEATVDQIKAAREVVKSFDPSKKYDPDESAFLEELASHSEIKNDEFLSFQRALKISSPEGRKRFLERVVSLAALSIAEKAAEEHAVALK